MMTKWKLHCYANEQSYLSKNGALYGLWIHSYGDEVYNIYFSAKIGLMCLVCSDTDGNWYGWNGSFKSIDNMKIMTMPDIARNVITPRLHEDPEVQHYSKFVVRRHEEIWNAMSDSNPFIQRDDWTVRYLVLGLDCSYPVVYAVIAALWVPPEEVVEIVE
jgi:hypothetical protein